MKENILRANDDVAQSIRKRLDAQGTLMINIISSPGAGKTAFLERTGPLLREEGIAFVVLTGDCFTSRDAERMDALGLPVVQINTGNACHIDAQLIDSAMKGIDLAGTDLIVVENVGNLVCPAEFDLGEDMKIAFLSTAEGHDKPSKYPLLIEEGKLAIINKTDLLPYLDFDAQYCRESIKKVNPGIKILEISCRTGDGIDGFIDWIKDEIKIKKEKNA
ncbi:MAG: hydrogenase nickel incorporation protein HypB [Candidatus Omnitrophica bacterium]|nr:hydrogenase nickel incorporation protein HypB [Candidatus Omnitrophota bacterium]